MNALEGSYPVPGAGGQFIVANYNLASLQTEDIYIEFWAKMPGAKGGCKFVKIFGDRPTSNNFAEHDGCYKLHWRRLRLNLPGERSATEPSFPTMVSTE